MSCMIHNTGTKLLLTEKRLYKLILDVMNPSAEGRGDSKANFEWVLRETVPIPGHPEVFQ